MAFKPQPMKMPSVGSCQTLCNSSFSLIPISHIVITPSPPTPNRTHGSNSLSFSLYVNACPNDQILQGRAGFSVCAAKKRTSGNSVLEMDDFDEDEEEEEEADGVYMPFMGMTEWFQKKPSGFGEGKEYDTSIEDKLVEEIEQSRRAQLANINKLKNTPPNAISNMEVNKAPVVIPSGVRVRVGSLPKKRNIHRDLQLAFKGFPAIVNISPAVSGNKKTRDPICKGFAYVYLGSEEAAKRFVQTYSKKSVVFGKTQKQITCEISNPRASEHSAEDPHKAISKQILPRVEEDSVIDPIVDDNSLELWEVNSDDESIGLDDQSIAATSEELEEGIEHINQLESDNDENMSPMTIIEMDSPSRKQHKKAPTAKKKSSAKGKSEKAPKLNIPGSTKRLKIKEKAVLADVFSKYASKASGSEKLELMQQNSVKH